MELRGAIGELLFHRVAVLLMGSVRLLCGYSVTSLYERSFILFFSS